MKLTNAQRDILTKMQHNPDGIHTAHTLTASISTLRALQNKGLVSGVVGMTRSMGASRGAWWKLTEKGKQKVS